MPEADNVLYSPIYFVKYNSCPRAIIIAGAIGTKKYFDRIKYKEAERLYIEECERMDASCEP